MSLQLTASVPNWRDKRFSTTLERRLQTMFFRDLGCKHARLFLIPPSAHHLRLNNAIWISNTASSQE